MIFSLLKHSISMIGSSFRMPGRSWLAELVARSVRGVFLGAYSRGIPHLKRVVDKSAGYHPIVSKVSSHTRDIAGVSCMLVSPKSGATSDKVVVYYHGGGYIVGSPKSHKTILAKLAMDTQGLVVAVDYRLAPEHPFPAPQDDCLAVALLVLKTYHDKKITLAGDSAGGALAIATALELVRQKAGLPSNKLPDNLVLLSPWVDPLANSGTLISNQMNDYLSNEVLDESIEHLMQGQDLANSKINFLNTPLSDLPKTLVQCGKGEMFYDQIVEFCDRAKTEGVNIELQSYRAQFHVFQLFSAILKDAEEALDKIGKFINS